MERLQGKGGMWGFLRGRQALLTSPGPDGSAAANEVPFEPPPGLPTTWDPMETWLPKTPTHAAAPPAAPSSSDSSAQHRSIFSAAWSKVKRRFGRSGGKGVQGRGSSTAAGELFSTAGAPLPLSSGPSSAVVLYTTGSAPMPAATISTTYNAGSQSRIPKPPSGASGQGGRSASGSSAHGSALASQLPQPALQAAPPAPAAQATPKKPAVPANGRASLDPVRRLAFSPADVNGRPGRAAPIQPGHISITAASPGGQQDRRGLSPGWQQQVQGQLGQQAQQAQPQPSGRLSPGQLLPVHAQHAGASASSIRQAGSQPEQANGISSIPAPYATAPLPFGAVRSTGVVPAGTSWVTSSGFAAQQLHLLGVPARSGLAGRWVREGGFPDAAGAAEVDFVLRIPQPQAAAREATRHLKVVESDGEMVLEWATQLRNGARILRPEAYAKSGALTTVPRIDGRAGTAAAQLSFGIDGTVAVKTLQGPPVPALIHQKFKLSPDGTRLKVSLKAQQLESEWPGEGGAGGAAVAKQTTTWLRVHQ